MRLGASAVVFEDILFFAAAALMLFCAAYLKNSGEIRWQGFLGISLGAALYAFVVRNRFVDIGTAAVRWFMKAFVAAVRIFLFPIRLVLRAFKKPIGVVAWYTGKSLRRAKRIVRRTRSKVKLRVKCAALLLRKK